MTNMNYILLFLPSLSGEISRHMEHSGAKAIFTIPSLVHKVQAAGVWVCLSYEAK